MAKSARASTRKRNATNLRTKVFGPAHDARTARLSAKLQEIANTPKPETEKQMDVDGKEEEVVDAETVSRQEDKDEAMKWAGVADPSRGSRSKKSAGRIQKRNPRRKAKHEMVFPSEIARKKRQVQGKKK